jgi:hypothetical protein
MRRLINIGVVLNIVHRLYSLTKHFDNYICSHHQLVREERTLQYHSFTKYERYKFNTFLKGSFLYLTVSKVRRRLHIQVREAVLTFCGAFLFTFMKFMCDDTCW